MRNRIDLGSRAHDAQRALDLLRRASHLRPVRAAVACPKGDSPRPALTRGTEAACLRAEPNARRHAARGGVHLPLPPSVADGSRRVAGPTGTCTRGGSSVPAPI